MSDMSLQEQIAAIDEVIEYFGVVESDIKKLNIEVENNLAYLRQNGLRTEITEMVKSVKMGQINYELEGMLRNIKVNDLVYLEAKREYLMRAAGEQ